MAYMMDLIVEADGILSILSFSTCVLGHITLEICAPYDIGKNPLLGFYILNLFNTLSMYVL